MGVSFDKKRPVGGRTTKIKVFNGTPSDILYIHKYHQCLFYICYFKRFLNVYQMKKTVPNAPKIASIQVAREGDEGIMLCHRDSCTTETIFLNLYGGQELISKESIPPAHVAWRAGNATLFLLGSQPPWIVLQFQHRSLMLNGFKVLFRFVHY